MRVAREIRKISDAFMARRPTGFCHLMSAVLKLYKFQQRRQILLVQTYGAIDYRGNIYYELY